MSGMECGAAIFARDINGSYNCRFIAQCGGRFLLISHSGDYRNGYVLGDWRGVLRELVALAVPRTLTEKIMTAESSGPGRFVNIPLTWPLSAKSLADLLCADLDAVSAELADLTVPGGMFE